MEANFSCGGQAPPPLAPTLRLYDNYVAVERSYYQLTVGTHYVYLRAVSTDDP